MTKDHLPLCTVDEVSEGFHWHSSQSNEANLTQTNQDNFELAV